MMEKSHYFTPVVLMYLASRAQMPGAQLNGNAFIPSKQVICIGAMPKIPLAGS
jgi:hypothetical protein